MRSIVVLLLLVIFFLVGTVFGIKSDDLALIGEGREEKVESVEVVNEQEAPTQEESKKVEVEKIETTQVMNMEEPVNFTQKTASFLEAGVKVFYDAVVTILYQISQLFY